MTSELTNDGAVIWSTLADPRHGFARAVTRQRVLTVVLFSTLITLLATGLLLPSLDPEAVAGEALRPDMTPHERTQAIETAAKLHQVTSWAAATVGPVVSAFFLALALWLSFRVAGAKAGFKASFTVAAHALVPQALKALLMVPAAMKRAPVSPAELPNLLPSSLSAWLPPTISLPGPAMAAVGALDLFTLWSLFLIGSGMSKASGASKLRTAVVMLVLFAAYIAVFKVVPSSGGFGPGGDH